MCTISLTDRVALTTERAESSCGIPVLVIDGAAYGSGDAYGPALRAALEYEDDPLPWLNAMYSGYQLLRALCRETPEAIEALNAFSPLGWMQADGEKRSA